MSRALLVLNSQYARQKALAWIAKAPAGTRLEFKAPKRSLPQNDFMWSLLTDIAQQCEHSGRKYPADGWKIIFMAAIGREVQFIPSLDGKSFIPWGQSSSDLTKKEMSDLIEFMLAWGAENNVVFHDAQVAA